MDIKQIERRIYDKNGGAKYDYANFCTNADFEWVKDEIISDLDCLKDNIENDIDEEDLDEEDLDEFFEEGYENFINNHKRRLLSELNEVKSDILYYSDSSDLVYNHLRNEVENRSRTIEQAAENLEKLLVEKSVMTAEELRDLDGYKQAIAELS